MNLIGDSVYSEFLVPTEVPRLATAVLQHKLSLDSNEIYTELEGMLEEGMGVSAVSSPASMVPPDLINDKDELSKGGAEEDRKTATVPPVTMSQETDKDDDEDQKPPSEEVCPSTSELKGGSKKDAIDVDEIAARAEDIFVLEPERLTDVYKFIGVLEFVKLPNQGCAERKVIVNSWRDTKKNGYSAIHLYQLSNWFKDFRFSAMVHPPPLDVDDCKNSAERKDFWHFGLFVIDPKARSLEKESQEHYRDRQIFFKGKLLYHPKVCHIYKITQ